MHRNHPAIGGPICQPAGVILNYLFTLLIWLFSKRSDSLRRSYAGTLCILTFVIFAHATTVLADEFPSTSDRDPVPVLHFPDNLHAVVWRNWGLVPTDRLATTLGTTPDKIVEIATSMGLPLNPRIPAEMSSRGYITILRRNWHLLPYEQIEQLLNISPQELAFRLREDDFLFIKLGSFKPKCEPVKYAPPSEDARHRSAEIKELVKCQFGGILKDPEEPRFAFVKTLSEPVKVDHASVSAGSSKEKDGSLRFVYSYFAMYGDSLSNPELDPFPDGMLARLHSAGVNGVWMHVVLRQLAPGGASFPEFGDGCEQRIANLRKLVNRAKQFGIDVYLYLNEPRAMPTSFFDNRPQMAGVTEDGYTTLCTSNPEVRKWLSDSLAYLFKEVPGLGGVFTITASENLTNCASHRHQDGCPRCKLRTEDEIIAEVNSAIEAGVHRSAPDAKVIAWDWGWKDHGDGRDIITQLPTSVWLMSVSEWGLPINRGGISSQVGEYAMSVIGPGPRATRHWELAKERGMKTVAKIQVNNTWELSSIPYLSVMDLIAKNCANLTKSGVNGLMLSWSLGGYPSANLELASRMLQRPDSNPENELQTLAEEHFGKQAAPLVRQAWAKFSRAFQEFPFDRRVVYFGPQQIGPANLLFAAPTHYESTMSGFPYDDLAEWRGLYPPEVFASQFSKVAEEWAQGLQNLEAAQLNVPESLLPEATADLRVNQAAQIHFASTANQAKFVLARDKLLSTKDVSQKRALRQELIAVLDSEIDLARRLYNLANVDSRIGFEACNQYFYVPFDLVEKVINCSQLREQYVSEN